MDLFQQKERHSNVDSLYFLLQNTMVFYRGVFYLPIISLPYHENTPVFLWLLNVRTAQTDEPGNSDIEILKFTYAVTSTYSEGKRKFQCHLMNISFEYRRRPLTGQINI